MRRKRSRKYDLPEQGFELGIFECNFCTQFEFSRKVRVMGSNTGNLLKEIGLYFKNCGETQLIFFPCSLHEKQGEAGLIF